jgi:hypothetical protein
MEIAESGGSLDAGKRGGAEAASFLAAQETLIVRHSINRNKKMPSILFFILHNDICEYYLNEPL